MSYPLISEYVEAIKLAQDNLDKLSYLRPALDADGNPIMSSGNFAVVFKMKDERNGKLHALKCFIKDQEGRDEAYKLIADELEYVSSDFITSIKYLEKELFVDTSNSDVNEFPVLLMDWVEGVTLDKYIHEHLQDQYALHLITFQFCRLAAWLMAQPFAHGDLKPDNILVKDDGSLVLVDYDGLFVPAMKGQKAREIGSPDYRHPLRTIDDFNEHIDDFSLATIAMQLYAIALQPNLLTSTKGDTLLLTEVDYRNLSKCQMMSCLLSLVNNAEFAKLLGLFFLSYSENSLSKVSFRAININKPTKPFGITSHISPSIQKAVGSFGLYTDNQFFVDTRDGNRYKTVKIGNQIWMAENLRFIVNLGRGAYVYGNSSTIFNDAKSNYNYKTYGLLYNFETAQIACPEGWHIPTDNEWKELEMYLGMSEKDCNKMSYEFINPDFSSFINPRNGVDKVLISDKQFWNNQKSISGIGFNARPAGWKNYQSVYKGLADYAVWWTSTDDEDALGLDLSDRFVFFRSLHKNVNSIIRSSANTMCCLSVRCIKDN